MMLNIPNLIADYHMVSEEERVKIWDEIRKIKRGILRLLEKYEYPSSVDFIYDKLGCADITMYLAIHELVLAKRVYGLSPYDIVAPTIHTEHFLCQA